MIDYCRSEGANLATTPTRTLDVVGWVTSAANLKQTLAKGDSAVRQGRAFRTNSTRPANKSVAINRTSEAA